MKVSYTIFTAAILALTLSTATVSAQNDYTVEQYKLLQITLDGDEKDELSNVFTDELCLAGYINPTRTALKIIRGFFLGDGQGGPGTQRGFRTTLDEPGIWQYMIWCAEAPGLGYKTPSEALSMSVTTKSPHRTVGQITVNPQQSVTNPKSFFTKGKLRYDNGHLRFANGEYFLKTGTNSPETLLGYAGFDDTIDLGGIGNLFLHTFANHVQDFRTGDPEWVSADTGVNSAGIIGAVNYLSDQGVNSMYFLPMNLGGDGQSAYPFVSPNDKEHYDISKLEQWHMLFKHMNEKGIAPHFVLAETEGPNENYFNGMNLTDSRKLFFAEMLARFGYLSAIWNTSEETDFSAEQIVDFSEFIHETDKDTILVAHNNPNNLQIYRDLINSGNGDAIQGVSLQYNRPNIEAQAAELRSLSANYPWYIAFDEVDYWESAVMQHNYNEYKRTALWPALLNGAGIEWYMGYHPLFTETTANNLPNQYNIRGDVGVEDFRTREKMWERTKTAHDIVSQLPFYEMEPAHNLVSNAPANNFYGDPSVFVEPASDGATVAVYFPLTHFSANQVSLNLSQYSGDNFTARWMNTITGMPQGSSFSLAAGQTHQLPSAPANNIRPIFQPNNNGNISVDFENENLELSGQWITSSEGSGYIGESFIKWVGPNYFNSPGNGAFEVCFDIQDAGQYFLKLHNYHTDPDPTEQNDVWVREALNRYGSGTTYGSWIKTFSNMTVGWNSDTRFDLAHDDQPPASFNFPQGRHCLGFSGRSTQFGLDMLTLSRQNSFNLNEPASSKVDRTVREDMLLLLQR